MLGEAQKLAVSERGTAAEHHGAGGDGGSATKNPRNAGFPNEPP